MDPHSKLGRTPHKPSPKRCLSPFKSRSPHVFYFPTLFQPLQRPSSMTVISCPRNGLDCGIDPPPLPHCLGTYLPSLTLVRAFDGYLISALEYPILPRTPIGSELRHPLPAWPSRLHFVMSTTAPESSLGAGQGCACLVYKGSRGFD